MRTRTSIRAVSPHRVVHGGRMHMEHTAINAVSVAGDTGDGGAGEWVQLLPAGPEVVGRDGRRWVFGPGELAAVLAAFAGRMADLPIDWEHASEHRAPHGHRAPAAGWVDQLEEREGALWGRVQWTEEGRADVQARRYRYLSPVFAHDREGRIRAMLSAGLTNMPNLPLTALNREGSTNTTEDAVDTTKLLQLLGLPKGADEAAVEKAINRLKEAQPAPANTSGLDVRKLLGLPESAGDGEVEKAINAMKSDPVQGPAVPSLDRFVPRADYDTALNRATAAESALAKQAEADREAKITAAVDAAIAAGKVAPASKDFYVATCRAEGGLEQFEKFVASAPKVVGGDAVPDTPPSAKGGAVDEGMVSMCRALGMTDEEIKAMGGA